METQRHEFVVCITDFIFINVLSPFSLMLLAFFKEFQPNSFRPPFIQWIYGKLKFSLTCDVFIDFSMFTVEILASWFGSLNYIASTKCHCASWWFNKKLILIEVGSCDGLFW
jgi:hypothetical protein